MKLALAILLLVCIGSCSFLFAATFTPTKFNDTDDGVCDSDCSLREAVVAANTLPGVDTINLSAGHYTLTIPGQNEDASATGDLDITDSVNIIGAGAKSTIIDGMGLDRVFHVISGPSVISGVTIRRGHPGLGAPGGGGILESNPAGAVTLTLNDSTVENNTASNGGGMRAEGTMTINNCTISGNTASGSIAGIFVAALSNLVPPAIMAMTNSTVSGNVSGSAGNGAGIGSNSGSNTADVTLNNVTVTDNTANDITGTAIGTGGVFAGGNSTIHVKNTIIAGNRNVGGISQDCSGLNIGTPVPLDSQGHNLIQNLTGCTLTGDTTGNITGVSALVGPLQDNGGQTLTHALLTGSPAIDAGDNATCAATDQRGVLRPLGPACDIGSFEHQLFSDDFEDQDVSDWTLVGTWTATGGNLTGTVTKKGDAISPDFGGCTLCTFQANVRIGTAGGRLSLLGWFQDPKNDYVEVRLSQDKNSVLLKRFVGGVAVAKQSVPATINVGQTYNIKASFDGAFFQVFLDGVQIMTNVPAGASPAPNGNVAFRVKSTTGAATTGIIADVQVF